MKIADKVQNTNNYFVHNVWTFFLLNDHISLKYCFEKLKSILKEEFLWSQNIWKYPESFVSNLSKDTTHWKQEKLSII